MGRDGLFRVDDTSGADSNDRLIQRGFWGSVPIEQTFDIPRMAGVAEKESRMSIVVAAPGTRTVPTTPTRRRTAPGGRPALGRPVARSTVGLTPGSGRSAAACRVEGRTRPQFLLGLKVATVALLAVVGLGASAAEFATWGSPDPAVEYVQGDPAWAHVEGR